MATMVTTTTPRRKVPQCVQPPIPHSGLRILNRRSSHPPGSLIIVNCATNGERYTMKCGQDGQWSRPFAECPTYSQVNCPALPRVFMNGDHNSTLPIDDPLPYGYTVAFNCAPNFHIHEDSPNVITCRLPGVWSSAFPVCEPVPEVVEPDYITNSPTFISIIIGVVLSLIGLCICGVGTRALRWRQKQHQRKRWQRYFGYYDHRQSKTNIIKCSSRAESCVGSSIHGGDLNSINGSVRLPSNPLTNGTILNSATQSPERCLIPGLSFLPKESVRLPSIDSNSISSATGSRIYNNGDRASIDYGAPSSCTTSLSGSTTSSCRDAKTFLAAQAQVQAFNAQLITMHNNPNNGTLTSNSSNATSTNTLTMNNSNGQPPGSKAGNIPVTDL